MSYELSTRYDSRKSFYGKAQVEVEGDTETLYSYVTKVAQIRNGRAQVFGMYSQTTLRHIKEFLRQNGFKADTWQQIEKDYSPTVEEEKARQAAEDKKDEESFKLIGAIASLGEVFANTDKEKNDWKLRMLKAGLEKKGLSVPDDWESLSEEEKQRRLDGVIAIAKGER